MILISVLYYTCLSSQSFFCFLSMYNFFVHNGKDIELMSNRLCLISFYVSILTHICVCQFRHILGLWLYMEFSLYLVKPLFYLHFPDTTMYELILSKFGIMVAII